MLYDISFFIKHIRCDMRRHHFSTVDERRDRRRQADRRDLEGLAECHRRKLNLSDVFLLVHNRRCLARQIDPRLFHQTEIPEVITELFHTEPQPHFNEHRVARVLRALHEVFGSVSRPLVAVDPAVLHDFVAGTEKRIVRRHNALRKSRRHRDDLKGRSRLVRIVDAGIPPHLVQQILNFFFRKSRCILLQRERIVEVELRHIDTGIDFSVLRIHKKNRDAVRLFFCHRLFRCLLAVRLDIDIQADL